MPFLIMKARENIYCCFITKKNQQFKDGENDDNISIIEFNIESNIGIVNLAIKFDANGAPIVVKSLEGAQD